MSAHDEAHAADAEAGHGVVIVRDEVCVEELAEI